VVASVLRSRSMHIPSDISHDITPECVAARLAPDTNEQYGCALVLWLTSEMKYETRVILLGISLFEQSIDCAERWLRSSRGNVREVPRRHELANAMQAMTVGRLHQDFTP
jgi:hypothetical protein